MIKTREVKTTFMYFLCFLVLQAGLTAQKPAEIQESNQRFAQARKAQKAYEASLDSTPHARELDGKIRRATTPIACGEALRPYVEKKDRAIAPFLKARLDFSSECQGSIWVALVKLGELEYFDRLIEALSSSIASDRIQAVELLAQIGSREAFRELYELLDDNRDSNMLGHDRCLIPPLSRYVMDWLGKTVPNPVVGAERYSVEAWKAWFERNRHLID